MKKAQSPAVPQEAARNRLSAILRRLQSASSSTYALDPLQVSASEVLAKIAKRPEELGRSAKLFRVIDNIEYTAMAMPGYASKRPELKAIVAELRELTGWTSAD